MQTLLACAFLVEKCIPSLIEDLKEGDVGSPMDGHSLTRLMHKRGINVRYLGSVATLAAEQGSKLASIKILAVQEMIARAAKHILNSLLRGLPGPLISFAVAHFLNCLLGAAHNPTPKVVKDDALWKLYHDADFSFEALTVESLRATIQKEVARRFRYDLEENWVGQVKNLQLLREVALKLGLQLAIKDYEFGPAKVNGEASAPAPAPTPAPVGKKVFNQDFVVGDRYTVTKELGQGAYGIVWYVRAFRSLHCRFLGFGQLLLGLG